MKRVLIIGGTGFIGSAIVDAVLANGDEAQVLCRAAKPYWAEQSGLMFRVADIDTLSLQDCEDLLQGIDCVIYAAGVDERETPKGDAYHYYANKNIQPMLKFLQAAKLSNCSQFILLNSMFSWLDRTQPELNMYEKHPYIRSRVDQRDAALMYASDDLTVNVFEVPYVFGVDKKGHTQWWRLVNFARATPAIIFTKGGANMLHVKTLANACVAAYVNQADSGAYPIGDENLTWQQLFERLQSLDAGTPGDRGIIQLPTKSFNQLSKLGGLFKEALGIQSGLDNQYMGEIVTQNLFFDAQAVHQQLGSCSVSLNEALSETLAAVEKKSALKSLLAVALP